MNTKLIFHLPKIWMFIVKPVFLLRGVRERKERDSHSWLVLVKTKLLSWRIARAQYIFELKSSGGVLTTSVIGPWL